MAHGVEAAVAKRYAYGVALLQQSCNIVRVVQNRAAIVCWHRVENAVAHLLSVDERLVHAQTADVQRCLLHRLAFLQFEFLAEIARCQTTPLGLAFPAHGAVQPNPTRSPGVLGKQTHAPHRRRAPRCVALGGVDAHLPVASLIAFQRRALVAHEHR